MANSNHVGLSESEAEHRLQTFGPNQIVSAPPPSNFELVARQLKNVVVVLLFLAALFSAINQDFVEAAAVLLVLVLNTLIGFAMEKRALIALHSLKNLTQKYSQVLRDSKTQKIPTSAIVPDDLVYVRMGELVPADGVLLESVDLSVDESSLTGESVPVTKHASDIGGSSDQETVVYTGSHIVTGWALLQTTKTGMNTKLGHIAKLTQSADEEVTPLEKRLSQLGKTLMWVSALFAGAMVLVSFIRESDMVLMIKTSIALAIATIPESLPIIGTIALARGVSRMAKKNALVNRLSSIETLGATSSIVTDKTGTLTEGRMDVQEVFLAREEDRELLLRAMALNNNSDLSTKTGDTLELGLLRYLKEKSVLQQTVCQQYARAREIPFQSKTKMMATFHRQNENYFVTVKGAPEFLIERANLNAEGKDFWSRMNLEIAGRGLRVIGFAQKEVQDVNDSAFSSLTMLGLVGLVDPPRKGVKSTIELCQSAGIRIVMASGDQPATAHSIAKELGIANSESIVVTGRELSEELSEKSTKEKFESAVVFARVSPENKLRLVEALQQMGEVVAMTGDGVNDAPALKKADVGIAMGIRGTQVAQEVSDIVLKDDRFETIVDAVAEGRNIFHNIRRAVTYLLSCNLSEVLVVGLTSLITGNPPLTAMQILFLNLVTDVFPAIALALGSPASRGDLATSQPHMRASLLQKAQWQVIVKYGLIISGICLGVYYYSHYILEYDDMRARTMAFLTLASAQLFHIYTFRTQRRALWNNDIIKSPTALLSVAFCFGLIVLCVSLPATQKVLSLSAVSMFDWAIIVLTPLFAIFAANALQIRGSKFGGCKAAASKSTAGV
ncbi:MAG: ATPase [Bdellovibrionales bacterium CG10_big_fil_rev_8_21_14_0_10_45_34]|nr:MAG: ATPase [Bdellovibrionales bacterium CG10_big_fil_rev_8_21_14_0_10_45_34]